MDENICKIIKSGSKGNAVLYLNFILVDCGVSFKEIKPYLSKIKLVLLTHEHSDHFNINTIGKIHFERPGIKFICGEFLKDKIPFEKNVHVISIDYGLLFQKENLYIYPVKLYHDVPNFGYRICKDDFKIFHATDTEHLKGIEAKKYDLYAIESNYDEETIEMRIKEKEKEGKFVYERGSINSHLSNQQCDNFFFKNRKYDSILIRLHKSELNF